MEMQNGIPFGIALILAACGSAAFTTEANAQKQRRPAPARPQVGIQNFADSPGGMAGCFDPNLSGNQRRAAIAMGGRPCATSRASRGATVAASARNWPVGVWALRDIGCRGDTLTIMTNGVYSTRGERGLWSLNGNVMFMNPTTAGGQQMRVSVLARSADTFTIRNANGQVSHWTRCS
jgi:hypothetical protein